MLTATVSPGAQGTAARSAGQVSGPASVSRDISEAVAEVTRAERMLVSPMNLATKRELGF